MLTRPSGPGKHDAGGRSPRPLGSSYPRQNAALRNGTLLSNHTINRWGFPSLLSNQGNRPRRIRLMKATATMQLKRDESGTPRDSSVQVFGCSAKTSKIITGSARFKLTCLNFIFICRTTRVTDRRPTTTLEMQPNRKRRRAGCASSQHDGATET